MKPPLTRKVQRLLAANRMDETRATLRQACTQNPGDAEVWSLLGMVEGRMGRYEDAACACRRSLAVHPGHPAALANLGNALAMLGRHDEAVACHRQRLRLPPPTAAPDAR